MPKKKRKETQAEQSARFKKEVEKMIEAGELDPTEAEGVLDALVRERAATPSTDGSGDGDT